MSLEVRRALWPGSESLGLLMKLLRHMGPPRGESREVRGSLSSGGTNTRKPGKEGASAETLLSEEQEVQGAEARGRWRGVCGWSTRALPLLGTVLFHLLQLNFKEPESIGEEEGML